MKTYFVHSTAKSGKRFTLAAKLIEDEMFVASAVCSKKDNFSRKIGRLISEGRLNKGKGFLVLQDDDFIKVLNKYSKQFAEDN